MEPAPVVITSEERISLRTVGVDIGSATSQLVFSRLVLEKVGSRYVTVERIVEYESDIALTPYDGDTIDGVRLRSIVAAAYRGASIEPSSIDTGALIVTGVALERRNAAVLADVFAGEAGRFVTVNAGDRMEATLAAYGSGAAQASRDLGTPLLNIDIGGGTTKLAFCRDGVVESVAAVDVGARLVTMDAFGAVVGIEVAGAVAAARTGVDLQVGAVLHQAEVERLAADLADCVISALPLRPTGQQPGLRTDPLTVSAPVTGIVFSGGVAEYIYGRERATFGDLGPALAGALHRRVRNTGIPILPPTTGIRATVLGAAQYAVQVSGSTIKLAARRLLPLRGIPVAGPPLRTHDPIEAEDIADQIRSRLALFDAPGPVALPIVWTGSASYDRLDALASGVLTGLADLTAAGHPVILVFDEDVGMLVGRHFEFELASTEDVICIDCLELREFDFIDIGAPLPGATAVPVVIKSLVLGAPHQPESYS